MHRVNWSALENEAAALLQQYLRIDTSNPPGHELQAARWWAEQAAGLGIETTIQPVGEGRANFIARFPAAVEKVHPPLLLTHHMDVVPADETAWHYPPFRGVMADGFIYGRGALDIKSLGILHWLALKAHWLHGSRFNRDIYFVALSDEEVASQGVKTLLRDIYYRSLWHNATVWNEGGLGIIDNTLGRTLFTVAVSEKQLLWLKLIAHGRGGHGSAPHRQNANLILVEALHRVAQWKRSPTLTPVAKAMLEAIANNLPRPLQRFWQEINHVPGGGKVLQYWLRDPLLRSVLYDTISINVIRGGGTVNMIPRRAEAVLDCRLLPSTDSAQFILELNHLINDERVELEVIEAPSPSGVTPWDTPFFESLREILLDVVPDALIVPALLSGVSDSRFFRANRMDVYGIHPIIVEQKDAQSIHGADERISLTNLRMGAQVIYNLLNQYDVSERTQSVSVQVQ